MHVYFTKVTMLAFACFPEWDKQVHSDIFANVKSRKPQKLL